MISRVRGRIPNHYRRDGRDGERGAVLLLVALGIPMLIAATGVVVDLGQLFVVRAKLQATADATALAAASQLPDEAAVKSTALQYASLNYGAYGDVVVEDEVFLGLWESPSFTPVGSDAYPAGTDPNAVRVFARRTQNRENAVRLIFGSFLGKEWGNVDAAATAAWEDGPGAACVFQLDPDAAPGFEIHSDAHVTVTCNVKVNATDQCEALMVTSGASLTAESIDVNGSCGTIDCPATNPDCVDPDPDYNAGLAADPLADMAPPPVGDCSPGHGDFTKYEGVQEIGPTDGGVMVFCKGLTIAGSDTNITMRPGTYIMRGGGFSVESGASVTGDGVMIYNSCNLVGGCTSSNNDKDAEPVNIASGSSATLKAPSSGDYAGILFFQDRLMDKTFENKFESNVDISMDGVLYFPTQMTMFHSASGVDSKIALIAGRILVSSNTFFTFIELPSNAPGSLLGNPILRLVQ